MSQLSIEQVAQVAWEAGFRGDALVMAVAIAKGESAWKPSILGDESLADHKWGPSVGLFQIRSLRAETGTGNPRDVEQLADPRFNARAAWEISSGGTNFQPWSVYNNDLHLRHMDEARTVVADLEARNVFASGTIHVPGSAPLQGGGAPGDFANDPAAYAANFGAGPSPEDLRLQAFLDAAVAQRGDIYDFNRANAHDGTNANLADPDPEYFDCSELVQWAAHQAGVEITDGSWLQYRATANAGLAMSVEEALRTPGALLFKFSSDPTVGGRPSSAHVAISLGDGTVMEAASPSRGVDIFDATGRGWTHAGVIPGMGTTLPTEQTVSLADIPYEADSDLDGLRDQLEIFIGTDPFGADTDRDGFADVDELVTFRSNPLDYVDNPLAAPSAEEWRPPLTTADGPPPNAPIPAPAEPVATSFIPSSPPPAPPPPPPPDEPLATTEPPAEDTGESDEAETLPGDGGAADEDASSDRPAESAESDDTTEDEDSDSTGGTTGATDGEDADDGEGEEDSEDSEEGDDDTGGDGTPSDRDVPASTDDDPVPSEPGAPADPSPGSEGSTATAIEEDAGSGVVPSSPPLEDLDPPAVSESPSPGVAGGPDLERFREVALSPGRESEAINPHQREYDAVISNAGNSEPEYDAIISNAGNSEPEY
ncbi:MAG: NlpC/P60 family protein, partial [Actinomycetota bacterium]